MKSATRTHPFEAVSSKRAFTFALAATMFTLAATVLPHRAVASTAPVTTAISDIKGETTDGQHKDWSDVIAVAVEAASLIA